MQVELQSQRSGQVTYILVNRLLSLIFLKKREIEMEDALFFEF